MNSQWRMRIWIGIWVMMGLGASADAQRSTEWNAVSLSDAANSEAVGWRAYRSWVKVPDHWADPNGRPLYRDSVTMTFRGVDGAAFEARINGTKIGAEGRFPPDYEVGEVSGARYKVAPGILQVGQWNEVSLRFYSETSGMGVLKRAPMIHGYFLELAFDGEWEFAAVEANEFGSALAEEPEHAAYSEFTESSAALEEAPILMPGSRLSAEESLDLFELQEGLAIDQVLTEPLVAQPTHLSFDARGRLWVSQYRQYPYPAGLKMLSRDKYYRAQYDREPKAPPHHTPGRSLVSIHEDADRDGVYETNKVFVDGLDLANAALPVEGGVWVMHTPYLIFYPDVDGDDVPDGDPVTHLAGFGFEDTHSVANGLAMGPDGWIYGGQGSTVASRIRRVGLDTGGDSGVYHEGCMVWRYHPETREFEIFGYGGGNVFGVEFDAEGRLFSGHNGGDTRGWHYVQGGRLLKQGRAPNKYGPGANPYAFGDLPMMRSEQRIPRFSHATILCEGSALPEWMNGRFFAADPLHNNIVLSERHVRGATFETSDVSVPVQSKDSRFRPVFMTNGPDGAIYVADFYEEFIAHGQHYQSQIDPNSGRVYRIRNQEGGLERDIDLSDKAPMELFEYLDHPNKALRQMAARLLGSASLGATDRRALVARVKTRADASAFEGLWALAQAGALSESELASFLNHPHAGVRMWVIRLLGDRRTISDRAAEALSRRAAVESDLEVWSQFASTAQRIEPGQASGILSALLTRVGDIEDVYLPLMFWWAIETHTDAGRADMLAIFDRDAVWEQGMVRREILPRLARKLALQGKEADWLDCAWLIRRATNQESQRALMSGIDRALEGGASPALPDALLAAIEDAGVGSLMFRLRNGDAAAVEAAREIALDTNAAAAERALYVKGFGDIAGSESRTILMRLIEEPATPPLVRREALGASRRFTGDGVADSILGVYGQLNDEERMVAQATLASRLEWSRRLAAAVTEGIVDSEELSIEATSIMRRHGDPSLDRFLDKNYGLDPVGEDTTAQRVEVLRELILAEPGSPYRGRPIYLQRCASCHVLFHDGRAVGPELTSYQRDDLDALLRNIVDPNLEIREGYEGFMVQMTDGQALSGFVVDRGDTSLRLRGFDGTESILPSEEVEALEPLGRSLMPPGLLKGLSERELRDLFAYLRSGQPMLAD